MKYYKNIDNNPGSSTYQKEFFICRIDSTPDKITSERWDKKKKAWVFDPSIYLDITGVGDPYDYVEIAEPKGEGSNE